MATRSLSHTVSYPIKACQIVELQRDDNKFTNEGVVQFAGNPIYSQHPSQTITRLAKQVLQMQIHYRKTTQLRSPYPNRLRSKKYRNGIMGLSDGREVPRELNEQLHYKVGAKSVCLLKLPEPSARLSTRFARLFRKSIWMFILCLLN